MTRADEGNERGAALRVLCGSRGAPMLCVHHERSLSSTKRCSLLIETVPGGIGLFCASSGGS